ncbi:hypothetical protein [Sphingorhabdus sp.]|jgi:hypothetical protein|uniref:hypothetical protein n=1 Tax=Sphingorhabdus sp. TaxID=1902408 RepID=UPI0032B7669D
MNDQYLALVQQFFAGALLCNSVPHLVAGLQGRKFPTPFSIPATIGYSSALTNVFWGVFNAVVGLLLISAAPLTVGLNAGCISALLGAIGTGIFIARHFGRVTAGGR